MTSSTAKGVRVQFLQRPAFTDMETLLLEGDSIISEMVCAFENLDPMIVDMFLAEHDWLSPAEFGRHEAFAADDGVETAITTEQMERNKDAIRKRRERARQHSQNAGHASPLPNNNNAGAHCEANPTIPLEEMERNKAAMAGHFVGQLLERNPTLDKALVDFLNAPRLYEHIQAERHRTRHIDVSIVYRLGSLNGDFAAERSPAATAADGPASWYQIIRQRIAAGDVERSVMRRRIAATAKDKVIEAMPAIFLHCKVTALLTMLTVFDLPRHLTAYFHSFPCVVQFGNDLCYFLGLQFDRSIQDMVEMFHVRLFFEGFDAMVSRFDALRRAAEKETIRKRKRQRDTARLDHAAELCSAVIEDLWTSRYGKNKKRKTSADAAPEDDGDFSEFFVTFTEEERNEPPDMRMRRSDPRLNLTHVEEDEDGVFVVTEAAEDDDDDDDGLPFTKEEDREWQAQQSAEEDRYLLDLGENPPHRDDDDEEEPVRGPTTEERERSYSAFVHYCYGLLALVRPMYPVQFSRKGIYHPFPLEAMMLSIPYILTNDKLIVHEIIPVYANISKYDAGIQPSSMMGFAIYLQFFTETHLRMCLTDILTRIRKQQGAVKRDFPFPDGKIT